MKQKTALLQIYLPGSMDRKTEDHPKPDRKPTKISFENNKDICFLFKNI